MALKSVETAIADLAALDRVNDAFTALQRAMNDVAVGMAALSPERQKAVADEIEYELMDWIANKMPQLEVAAPTVTVRPPGKTSGQARPKPPNKDGAAAAIMRFLADNPRGGGAGLIFRSVSGTYVTHARDKKAAFYSALHNLTKGDRPRLQCANGVYTVIPGRHLDPAEDLDNPEK